MKESLLTEVFSQAILFLVLSAIIIPLLRSIKIPIALGYLLAGIAMGPYGISALGNDIPMLSDFTFQDTTHVKMLAEFGIILLLFVIGLEMTPRRLWQMRDLVFGLGGLQVTISAIIIGAIAYSWGNSPQTSVLLGLSLALSSTAIVIQWLHEQKLFVTPTGRTTFSVLLFQDLAVIPILFLLTIFTAQTDQNIAAFISISLAKMILTVLVIYLLGKKILKPVFVFANRHGGAEVFMALSLLVIIATASIAQLAGISMALGAFIAGLLLSDTEYRHEISTLIIPFKSMLLGIFFISFGMGIDLNYLTEKPIWLALSVIGLMSIKTAITYLLCRFWKHSNAISLESAILLSQAGEFGLLVTGSALTLGLMAPDVGQFMLLTVGITMIATPIIAPIARKIAEHIEDIHNESDNSLKASEEEEKKQHVVIFGFGRIGQTIADVLTHEGLEIHGFEKNIDNVRASRAKSMPVYYGDASRKATIEAAQLDNAICAVITIDDPQTTLKIVRLIRARYQKIPLIVRSYDQTIVERLNEYEYVYIVPEHIFISLKLAEKILQNSGYQEDETMRALQSLHEHITPSAKVAAE